MSQDKKQQGIIVDIHKTLLNHDNAINQNIYDIVKLLKTDYYICLVTSHEYNSIASMHKSIEPLIHIYDYVYYNIYNLKNDIDVKNKIYKTLIEPKLNIKMIIDNNKEVLKMFRQLGIDTLRFKHHSK